MWNSNSLSLFQQSIPYAMVERREKPPKSCSRASLLTGPSQRLCLGELSLNVPGAGVLPGTVTSVEPCAWFSLSAEISSSHSTPLLYQREIRQISVNLRNYLFALQRVAEKRNARLVRHWSQWGNSSLLFPLNAKVHLIYLERCGVLQRHSRFRQPEMWAAVESGSPTPSFVLEVLFSPPYAE